MLNYLSGPTILLFCGGLLSVGGALWAGISSTKQNNIINNKNEEIKVLTQENQALANRMVNLITGGDSYAYYEIGARHVNGIYQHVGLKLRLVGNFPLSDVTIKIVRMIASTNPAHTTQAYDLEEVAEYQIPLITHDLFLPTTKLPLLDLSDEKNKYIKVSITARNGEINQIIKFEKKDNGFFSMATQVSKYTHEGNGAFKREKLFENVDPDFPVSIDWNQ